MNNRRSQNRPVPKWFTALFWCVIILALCCVGRLGFGIFDSSPSGTNTPERIIPSPVSPPTPVQSEPSDQGIITPQEQASTKLPAQDEESQPSDEDDSAYYKNCAEVRAAGKAPLHKGEPGYRKQLDRDGDGIACDK